MAALRPKSNATAYSLDLSAPGIVEIYPTSTRVDTRATSDSDEGQGVNLNLDVSPGDLKVAVKMHLDDAVFVADTILDVVEVEELAKARERIRIGCPYCRQHHGNQTYDVNLDNLPVVTYLNNRSIATYPSSVKPADPGEVATLWSVKFQTADGVEHGPYHFTGQRYSAYTDPVVKRLMYAGDLTTLASYAFGRQMRDWAARGYLGVSDSERWAEISELTTVEGSSIKNLLRVPTKFLHTDSNVYNGFGDHSLKVMFSQIDYQDRLDNPAPETVVTEGPTLREAIADYLHSKGYEGTLDEPWQWYRSDIGVRDFEGCLIWQMTKEGAYSGDTNTVAGSRPIEVPVPVNERNRYGYRTIVGVAELDELRSRPKP